ncbi:hypothetical protein LQT97_14795 [Brucella pseudogrignonensis]|uniref:hypothetical protein n=1 Tax=Brucella pseudogrignonensis TaxID=419475 RepID=UPI001E34E43A|nr:hypothetical protein [Brucella pseudogrignonensis]MCD4512492.1 hypothetical protein [Brucella pseudogrignonensis]
MARPRTPRAKAAVEASDKKNPQRFKNRTDAKADGPLGNPPAWLKDTPELKAKAAWKLFEKELPWLNQSHRTLVGMAANIQGRIMAGQEVGVQAMNLLRQMLGQMGATPADASKVATGDGDDEKDDLLD